MSKFIKKITAAVMACAIVSTVAVSATAKVCPPHNFEYVKTTSTIIGAETHPYVESVTNNKPTYGTCVVQNIKTEKLYQCVCGETKTETSYHWNHTKCGE